MASLFQACKSAVRNKEGGTFNIGGYDIDIEMYGQQDIDDDIQYGDVAFGDSDESKIVLVANDTITVPAGYILTPDSPKKSLVIYCNHLINNGTISMYQKAPNVLPHDYYIIEGSVIGSNRNIIVPAYANNRIKRQVATDSNKNTGINGNNGVNRNCGSGGTGSGNGYNYNINTDTDKVFGASGSGYAFGGGAGSGGSAFNGTVSAASDVDSTYPMRGGKGATYNTWCANFGGVGNPIGEIGYNKQNVSFTQNFGCGGRIIIFCISFINNGTITVNGTDSKLFPLPDNPDDSAYNNNYAYGGASGAGAIDLFYTTLAKQGTIIANGGNNFVVNYNHGYSGKGTISPGKGGNGSITLTQWNLNKVIKEERKMFTKDNWVYLFSNYSQRLKEDVI